MSEVSVVVSLYNEEENIKPLIEAIDASLGGLDYEVLLVDDGSTDRTVLEIKKHMNEHYKLIMLNRNYGQTNALKAGIDEAQGRYIVTMDGDLQNDPSDIRQMLHVLETRNADMVIGRRANRQDGFILRKLPSMLANLMIRKLTGVPSKDLGCSLKLFRASYAKSLELHGELHRFISILAHLDGARIVEVDVKHHARIHGESKYGLSRTIRVLCDLMLILFLKKYLQKPIHLFGSIGAMSLMFGLGIELYLLCLKILGNDIGGRPLLTLGAILCLAGLQFVSLGLMLELMMRNYYNSSDKKSYKVRGSSSMAKLANRKHLKKCLALLGSLVILGLLFHKIGVKNLLNEIVKVNPWAVLTAFVFYNISQLLSSLRLYMLMNCKTRTTKTLAAKIYYRSMFFSTNITAERRSRRLQALVVCEEIQNEC